MVSSVGWEGEVGLIKKWHRLNYFGFNALILFKNTMKENAKIWHTCDRYVCFIMSLFMHLCFLEKVLDILEVLQHTWGCSSLSADLKARASGCCSQRRTSWSRVCACVHKRPSRKRPSACLPFPHCDHRCCPHIMLIANIFKHWLDIFQFSMWIMALSWNLQDENKNHI